MIVKRRNEIMSWNEVGTEQIGEKKEVNYLKFPVGVTKNIKGKKVRFSTGIRWFKRSYYSCRKKYYLKTYFTIYQG